MKTTIISLGLLIAAGAAHAVNPMWVRDARISPDGTRIVFSYKGDLYTVPVQGGDAVRVTTGPAYESAPVWSPDGRSIAYASDRNGGKDIFIIPAEGGAPRQLTFNSAAETPEALPTAALWCFRRLFRIRQEVPPHLSAVRANFTACLSAEAK